MANLKHSKTQIDLVRFGYAMRDKLDRMEMSYSEVTELTNVTRRQISDAAHGRPISAGATYLLFQLLEFKFEDFLPLETVLKLKELEIIDENHAVTLDVPCETGGGCADA